MEPPLTPLVGHTRPTSAPRPRPARASSQSPPNGIETEFDNQLEPNAGDTAEAPESGWAPGERQKVTVEVGGRRLEVVLPAGLGGLAVGGANGGAAGAKKAKRSTKKAGAAASADSVTPPMQGTIVKVVVEEGQEVAEGDTIVVVEAMKMEQPLKAHKAGTITRLQAEAGAPVTNGAAICDMKD